MNLDRIYDMIDHWMINGQLDQIEAYIAAITYTINLNLYDVCYEPNSNDIDNYLAVLTASLPVRTQIKNRRMLYDLVTKFTGKELLAGLE